MSPARDVAASAPPSSVPLRSRPGTRERHRFIPVACRPANLRRAKPGSGGAFLHVFTSSSRRRPGVSPLSLAGCVLGRGGFGRGGAGGWLRASRVGRGSARGGGEALGGVAGGALRTGGRRGDGGRSARPRAWRGRPRAWRRRGRRRGGGGGGVARGAGRGARACCPAAVAEPPGRTPGARVATPRPDEGWRPAPRAPRPAPCALRAATATSRSPRAMRVFGSWPNAHPAIRPDRASRAPAGKKAPRGGRREGDAGDPKLARAVGGGAPADGGSGRAPARRPGGRREGSAPEGKSRGRCRRSRPRARPGDALAARALASGARLGSGARRAVDAGRDGVDGSDAARRGGIASPPIGRRPAAPRAKAAGRDARRAGHGADGMGGPVRPHPPVRPPGAPLAARRAVAPAGTSHSRRGRRSSRRRRGRRSSRRRRGRRSSRRRRPTPRSIRHRVGARRARHRPGGPLRPPPPSPRPRATAPRACGRTGPGWPSRAGPPAGGRGGSRTPEAPPARPPSRPQSRPQSRGGPDPTAPRRHDRARGPPTRPNLPTFAATVGSPTPTHGGRSACRCRQQACQPPPTRHAAARRPHRSKVRAAARASQPGARPFHALGQPGRGPFGRAVAQLSRDDDGSDDGVLAHLLNATRGCADGSANEVGQAVGVERVARHDAFPEMSKARARGQARRRVAGPPVPAAPD